MLTACPFSLPSGDGNKDFYRNKIRQHTAEISDGFFSSRVTPNTSFLHLSLLSQFPKNKPSVNIIEAWQPAIGKTDSISHSHFLPLSLDDWGGEIMLEQFGRRPSDCHLMAYTSFLVCVLQNIWPVRKNHEKKKPTTETWTNNWDGKASVRRLLPVILHWTRESPGLEQLLTPPSPPLHSVFWNSLLVLGHVTRFRCIFILPHYILAVSTWAQASVTVPPLRARRKERSSQTRVATRFWLLCALGLLCSIDMYHVTRLTGGFLKQKKS